MNTNMKKSYQSYPYEFLFMINGNPIVGRNFPIKNFNRESLSSLDLKDVIDDVVDVIKLHFKNNTYEYLYKYYSYFTENNNNEEYEVRDIYENEDFFTFQIKVNNRVIAEKIFTGNDFPPKVRYDVDIRKIIPKMIEIIQIGLSQKNYTKNYGDYDLTKIFINNQI
jgi:hypothetical protein